MRRTALIAAASLFAVLFTPMGAEPARGASAPAAPLPAAAAPEAEATACSDFAQRRTCQVTFPDVGPDGYVDVPVPPGVVVSMMVYGGQAGGVDGYAEAGAPGGLVAVKATTPANGTAVRFQLGRWGDQNENGEPSYASWVYADGGTGGILTAPGGGDPGGAVVAEGVETLAITGGGSGNGSALLVLGGALSSTALCIFPGQHRYEVPSGVDELAFIAAGGGGTHGNNRGPLQGAGGVIAGILDVNGITELQYWVGCSGYTFDGMGYGQPGQAGDAPGADKDGGAGGGTTLVQHIDDVVEVLAAAGGGGGVGGDNADPWASTGGDGGSSLGKYGDRWGAHGGGHHANQGVGGCAACNGTPDSPDADGSDGTGAGGYQSGGGGGGGSGFPRGGAGGGITEGGGTGGGGGAGGSYLSQTRATLLTMGPDNVRDSDGFLVFIPVSPPATTSLTVTASVSGPGSDYARGPYVAHVMCTNGNSADTLVEETFTIGIGPSAGHTLTGLPVAGVCTVEEVDWGGATEPGGPVQQRLSPSPATVNLDNVYDVTNLAVVLESTFNGDSAHPDPDPLPLGELAVHIVCSLDGHDLVLPVPVSNTGDVAFTGSDTWASGGVTRTIPDVPLNAYCTATHTAGVAEVTFNTDEVSGTGQISTYVAPGDGFWVQDAYPLVPLTIHSVSSGTGAPPTAVYDIAMSCTYQGSAVDLTPGQTAFSVTAGEATIVHNVPVGTECTTTESNPGTATAVQYSPSQTITIVEGSEQTITNVFGAASVPVDPPAADEGSGSAGDPTGDVPSATAPTATAPLTVVVQVAGEAAWAANTGFVVDVACTIDGEPAMLLGPEGRATLSFDADGAVLPSWAATQLASMPVGSECSAVETTTGGATSVEYRPGGVDHSDTVTITQEGAAITVVNTFDAAALIVATKLSGNDLEGRENTAFLLEQRCRFNGTPLDLDDDAPALAGQFWLHGEDFRTFPGLPVGAECEVHETDAFEATLIEPGAHQDGTIAPDGLSVTFTNVYDVTGLQIRQPLLGQGAATYGHIVPPHIHRQAHALIGCWTDESRVTRVRLPDDGIVPLTDDAATLSVAANAVCEVIGSSPSLATMSATSPSVITTLGDDHLLELSRTFDVASLSIDKRVIGDTTRPRFGFSVACRWQGATGDPFPVPLNAGSSPTLRLADGGHATRQVISGSSCVVAEQVSHDVRSISIAVTEPDGGQRTVAGRSATVTAVADAPTRLVYTNVMAGTMPVTGADAAGALLAAVALLLAGAVLMVVRRLRRVP